MRSVDRVPRGRIGILYLVGAVLTASLAACGGSASSSTRTTSASIVAAPVRTAQTSMGTVGYRSVGSGPPLLLITGYAQTINDWPPDFIDALAERHRVIALDNAGVGQTSPLPGRLTISGMADQTDAFIRAQHLGHVAILGQSMGGMIAQALATLHPADVDRLILCATEPGNGTAVAGNPSAAPALLHPRDVEGMDRLLFPAGHDQATQVAELAAQTSSYPSSPPPPLAIDRGQLIASLAWSRGLDPAGARLTRITAPTLIADGDDDVLAPPENSRLLHRDIAGSRLVLYPGAGHGFLFQNVATSTSAIEAFLA